MRQGDHQNSRGADPRKGVRFMPLPTPGSSQPQKIPKPLGEPGRPGSGGHCIESVLINDYRWSKHDVDALTENVRAEARHRLDMTVSFRNQKKDSISKICDKMMMEEHWPQLRDYNDCWPVRSILKLALKYGAEASRRTNMKETNKRLHKALRGSEARSTTSPEI
ncbi:hypothetical protein BD779DRAFT_1483251 [Infundibulicybe gibba]|nr:hypothetical protein BD779DRAFT_1483251 [Infundibulicybe gibba]